MVTIRKKRRETINRGYMDTQVRLTQAPFSGCKHLVFYFKFSFLGFATPIYYTQVLRKVVLSIKAQSDLCLRELRQPIIAHVSANLHEGRDTSLEKLASSRQGSLQRREAPNLSDARQRREFPRRKISYSQLDGG